MFMDRDMGMTYRLEKAQAEMREMAIDRAGCRLGESSPYCRGMDRRRFLLTSLAGPRRAARRRGAAGRKSLPIGVPLPGTRPRTAATVEAFRDGCARSVTSREEHRLSSGDLPKTT